MLLIYYNNNNLQMRTDGQGLRVLLRVQFAPRPNCDKSLTGMNNSDVLPRCVSPSSAVFSANGALQDVEAGSEHNQCQRQPQRVPLGSALGVATGAGLAVPEADQVVHALEQLTIHSLAHRDPRQSAAGVEDIWSDESTTVASAGPACDGQQASALMSICTAANTPTDPYLACR
jgi:hypothetical protein